MDNHYVPNLTIGPMVCSAIRPHVTIPIDVHLMVEPVDRHGPDFAKAGANLITFHPEASAHVDRTSAHPRCGCKAGLVFNPATPLSWLDHVMDRLDLVLLMSVNPGFGGQSVHRLALPKLREVRGASTRTSGRRDDLARGRRRGEGRQHRAVAAAGADTFVAGSAIFGAPDPDGGYRGVIARLRSAASAG
jgi:ribulose-phosphate 3-epimerase